VDAGAIREALAAQAISVSAQAVPDARLDIEGRVPDLVRASVHYFNTTTEIERFAAVMEKILAS